MKGAEINSRNNLGYTALHRASGNGHCDVVQLLLEKGANIHVRDNNGGTSMDVARDEGHWNIVYLLEHGGCWPIPPIVLQDNLKEIIHMEEEKLKKLKLSLKAEEIRSKMKHLEGNVKDYRTIIETLKKLDNEQKSFKEQLETIISKVEQNQETIENLKTNAAEVKEKVSDYANLKAELQFLENDLACGNYDVINEETVLASSAVKVTCPICFNNIKRGTSMYQCGNGHWLCEVCYNHKQMTECPFCRMKKEGNFARNLGLEAVIEGTADLN